MKILALDTSTQWLSVAIFDGSATVAIRERVGNAASERILPAIGKVLAHEGLSLAALDGIAFGAGPGSFTGVRVACGVAQGLAFGAGRPLFAVSTLEAIAQSAWRAHGWQRVIACIDARMHEVYVAAYARNDNRWTTERAPVVCKPAAVNAASSRGWFGAGDGFAVYPPLAGAMRLDACDARIIPDAQSIAECAWPQVEAGAGIAAEKAEPLYVRHRVALTASERAAGARL
ncbi:MAG TPA: tRNA (adenosine(37)-N6)-threonylcarbamoyltransferase complex dimerization subunit type 1 TsaB [Casimicrobiaceae bacterium]|jgi:tRNA threonylcarbamoyladenosine biosynthesis protein TsaB|nr:tRNA (adenosine(37)-N6)-threonylcarbamoyltransferase complex dimerization subunit type 1 TsaB [Casimicrobiaceae bacterium]